MSANHDTDLLLITCASGKQGTHLLRHLHPAWKCLRLQAHSENSVKRLKEQFPSADVVQADLSDGADATKLLDGVTALWHVGPSFHRHETQIGYNMIDAAVSESQKKDSKFHHFVYSSVSQSQLRKLLNHDAKRYVEEYLMESGLNFTILQPSHFLDMFPLAALAEENEPVYQAPFEPTAFSFSILDDYAEAAAKIFAQRETHYFAQYQLVSTYPIHYRAVVQAASKALGKDIGIQILPLGEAIRSLTSRILGTGAVHPNSLDGAERLLLYYNRRGLLGNPMITTWLLGRQPTTIDQWIRATLTSK